MKTTADMLREEGERIGELRGEQKGELKGKVETARDMLTDALTERFGAASYSTLNRIHAIKSPDTLRILFKQVLRVNTLEEFKEQLFRATDN